jgi:hypothetical protein
MNVLIDINRARYIVIVTPNKLFGALVPKVKLGICFNVISTLLEVDTLTSLRIMSTNTNDGR